MRIGIKLDDSSGPVSYADRVAHASAAAAAGFSAVWSAPHAEWDGLTVLAALGRDVPGIRLGTAIVSVYGRHPLVLASQALTIQALVGDRLDLGIGPGASFFVEENFGIPFDRPAAYMREYLAALGPLLRGEPASVRGELVRAAGEVVVPGASPPSLLLAALGPAMLRVAGECADGVMTTWTGPGAISRHVVPAVRRAAAAAGKREPRIVAEVLVSVTDKPGDTSRWLDERFGFMSGLPSYRAMLELEGVADPWVVGDAAAVERDLGRFAEAGVTDLIVAPFGPEADRDRTLALLAQFANAPLTA